MSDFVYVKFYFLKVVEVHHYIFANLKLNNTGVKITKSKNC